MRRTHLQEADAGLGLMALKPQQQQNQYKTPYIPSARRIAEGVCTAVGTQLIKGFEN